MVPRAFRCELLIPKTPQAKGSKAYEDLPCCGLVTHSGENLTTGKIPQVLQLRKLIHIASI